jgi:hypothetical protein
MPKYCYRCKGCDITFEAVHCIGDKLYDCEACETSGSLSRIPFVIRRAQPLPSGEKKPGELVDRFIKEAKEEVKIEKEQYKKEEYKG